MVLDVEVAARTRQKPNEWRRVGVRCLLGSGFSRGTVGHGQGAPISHMGVRALAE